MNQVLIQGTPPTADGIGGFADPSRGRLGYNPKNTDKQAASVHGVKFAALIPQPLPHVQAHRFHLIAQMFQCHFSAHVGQ